jgi:hypothetical protein
MAIGYGTGVVERGLVFYADFANQKCFNASNNSLNSLYGGMPSVVNYNSSALTYDQENGVMIRPSVNNGTMHFRSASNITLGDMFTMHALVKVTDTHDETANGIITNHSHGAATGAGINIKHVSTTDFRVSCNTGNGSGRTFHSYYGSTNIYNKWVFLTLRFIGSSFTLWVNDKIDYTGSYSQVNGSNPIDLFNWSTSYNQSNNYRPACSMSMASAYDTFLTDKEIKQNFEAYRGRFGL